MYEYISGMITKVTPKYIVVDVKGVGYQINVPNPYSFKMNDFQTVWTYFHVREDSNELFGFQTVEERDLFLKLISVTGIGPKTALPIIATASVDEIINAIATGNSKYMQKFPGIGPKAAQQIILDLGGKIDTQISTIYDPKMNDCEEALIALGYNKKDIAKVISKVDASMDTSNIIRECLKLLNK